MNRPQQTTATKPKRQRKAKPTQEQIAQVKDLFGDYQVNREAYDTHVQHGEKCFAECQEALAKIESICGPGPYTVNGQTVVIRKSRKGQLELAQYPTRAIEV